MEYADPAKVVRYIRASEKLRLKQTEIDQALSSISNVKLRHAFEEAHRMFLRSRKVQLPDTSKDCAETLERAAYYMEGDPTPGLCISHWRDDPIVAWLDDNDLRSREFERAAVRVFAPDTAADEQSNMGMQAERGPGNRLHRRCRCVQQRRSVVSSRRGDGSGRRDQVSRFRTLRWGDHRQVDHDRLPRRHDQSVHR